MCESMKAFKKIPYLCPMVCFNYKLQPVQTTYTILLIFFAHLPQVGLLQILHVAIVALVHFLP